MSVKQQILDAIKAKLESLKSTLSLSSVNRRRSVASESKDRSLDWVVGDEAAVDQDNQGFTLEFPVNFKITWRTESDGFTKSETMKSTVQTEMEADLQLGGLASAIEYQGEVDLSKDESWSQGCFVLAYTIQYRRKRGHPEQNY